MSSQNTPRVKTSCVCQTMRNRIEDIKSLKQHKQKIFDEITRKFGKQAKVQRYLLHVLEKNNPSELSLALVSEKLEAYLRKPSKSLTSTVELPSLPKPSQTEPKTGKSLSKPEDFLWASILKADTERFLQEEQYKIQRIQENKLRMKRELDKQVADRQKRLMDEKKISELYENHQKKVTEIQKNHEDKMKEELKNRFKMENERINEYVNEVNRKKIIEVERAKEYEQSVVKRVKDELIAEAVSKRKKKETEKQIYLSIIKENEEKNRERMERMAKEKQDDVAIMKEYTKMLEKQEEDRINYLKNRENSIQSSLNPKSFDALRKKNEQNAKEDLEIFSSIQEQQTYDRLQEEASARKKRKLIEELKTTYENQIKEKIQKKLSEDLNEKKIVNAWKQEQEDFFKYQADKSRDQKRLHKAHANFLQTQMLEKKPFT